jgi:hypothetical protein
MHEIKAALLEFLGVFALSLARAFCNIAADIFI